MNKKINFRLGESVITTDSKPFIIAEIGSNFDGDLEKAYKLIEVASECGVNAVKFQLFKADSLFPNKDGPYKIFKDIELNPDWIRMLKDCASKNGVHFLASAFDSLSLDTLEKNNVIAHKIASSETNNIKFLNKVARTGKPVLISTGMCDFVDIEEAINIMHAAKNMNICLMQCTSLYPLNYKDVNLNIINSFKKRYDSLIGFSDHTLDNIASIIALGLGSRVFEKHFTLNKRAKGPDHFYALEPDELKSYVGSLNNAFLCLGSHKKTVLDQEKSEGRRESIYASCDLKKDNLIATSDLILKRPGIGIRSRYLNQIVGSKLVNDIKKGSLISFDDISF